MSDWEAVPGLDAVSRPFVAAANAAASPSLDCAGRNDIQLRSCSNVFVLSVTCPGSMLAFSRFEDEVSGTE